MLVLADERSGPSRSVGWPARLARAERRGGKHVEHVPLQNLVDRHGWA